MRAEKLSTEVRQEQIAEAALALVAERGIGSLSIARVARRIGVVPSAIYRHYRTKDDILDAVLELIRSRLLANVEATCRECDDPLERLQHLLTRHVRLLRENQGIPRVVFSQELHHGVPQRKARMYGIIREYLDRITEIAQHGQREGRIRADVTPETIALLYLGILQPGALMWELSDGNFDVTRHAERTWQFLRASIEERDARGVPPAIQANHRNRKEQ